MKKIETIFTTEDDADKKYNYEIRAEQVVSKKLVQQICLKLQKVVTKKWIFELIGISKSVRVD